jgi:Tfp pilus assembly protein PilV
MGREVDEVNSGMMTERRFLDRGGWMVDVSKKDRGVSLIETMIAVLVALIGVFSVGTLIFQATVTNKNQGTEVTRATIYAQDKMEKLLSLSFGSCNQGIALNPNYCGTSAAWTYNSGTGTWSATAGLTGTGWNTGLSAGGILTPMQTSCPTLSTDPALGYVDFLDTNGVQLPSAAGACSTIAKPAQYIRMWNIQDVCVSTGPSLPAGCVGGPTGGPLMKQITVAVWSEAAVGTTGNKPVVTITSYVSNPN